MPTVATNTSANSALMYLNRNSRSQEKSLNKISSGSRIVTAGDDAAGLAVGKRMQADIATMRQVSNNMSQGISALKVADGAFSRIHDVLIRMKTLAAQSRSGTLSDTSGRDFLNTEYLQLRAEIDAIATTAEFNNVNVADGTGFTATAGVFLAGVDAADTIAVDLTNVDADLAALTLTTSAIDTTANANTALGALDTAIDSVSTDRATIGGLMSRLEFRRDFADTAIESLDGAKSVLLDVDIAAEQTNLTNAQVLTEAAIASLAQANQMKSSLLSLVR